MDEFNNWMVESKKNRKKNVQKLEEEENNKTKRKISFFSNVNWKEVQEEAQEFSVLNQLEDYIENLDEDLKTEEKMEEKNNKFKDYELNPFDYRIKHFAPLFSFQWPMEYNELERNFCSPFESITDEDLKEAKKKSIKEFLKQRLKTKKSEVKGVRKTTKRYNKK
eukprot:gene338-6752_t